MNIGETLRDHQKLAEECMELALIITQQLNKPRVDFTQDIVDEIGDVKWRLERIEKYYDSIEIDKRIRYKNERERQKKLGSLK
jgi:hypothetical protein